MESKKQLLDQFVTDNKPTTQLDHVLAYAELKTQGVTQLEYSKAVGISDRSLRQYISNNKTEYEDKLKEAEADKVPEIDLDNISRALTESQVDQFVQSLINSAISPTATVRDRQLLIDFAGLTADDLLNLQATKSNSIRWHIKSNVSNISKFMDAKELSISLQSSEYLYNGDKESSGNTNRFMNKSLEDETFKMELMLAGLTFYSLYNGVQHPELELMQTIVKLDRLERGIKEPMNMNEIKSFASGQDIVKDAKPTKVNEKANQSKIEAMLQEIDALTTSVPTKVKASDYKQATDKVIKLTQSPALPDVETVEDKATKHYDELQVLLSAEDEVRAIMRKATKK